ncbi:MAG: DUF4474 domain-containing protein [Oscillospiraceae bacterium]|jgi:hypothetical protein|nr:DUF4474 domain-containing protein [Oscillospiraceae bacterium]
MQLISWIQTLMIVFFSFLLPTVPGVSGDDGQPGVPAWDMAEYAQAKLTRQEEIREKTFGLAPLPRFTVTYDETLTAVIDELEAASKFSVPALTSLFPDLFAPFRPLERAFAGPVAKTQAWMNDASWTLSNVYHTVIINDLLRFASVTLGMAKEVKLGAEALEQPGLYEVICYITYEDGRGDQLRSGIYIDTKQQMIYGKGGSGMMGLGYDFDAKNQVLFTQRDVWMRSLGFCAAYDFIGNATGLLQFDTVRLKFPYDGRDWMIQIWKGRYTFASGGEVGVYNKPKSRLIEFYDSAEDADMLPMSLRVTVRETGQLLVDRPAEPHWWITGFRMIDRYYRPDELTLETSVTLRDQAMLDAFCQALDNQTQAAYRVSGLTVSIVW